MREAGPVYLFESRALISRYADVKQLMLDSTHFLCGSSGAQFERFRQSLSAEEQEIFDAFYGFEAYIVNRVNGEQHRRVRNLAHAAFTPRRINRFEDAVERYLDELLAPASAEEVTEFMTLAYQLPLLTIVDLLGFPRSDMDMIHSWTLPTARYKGRHDPDLLRAAHEAVTQFYAYVEERLAEHRSGQRPNELLEAMMNSGGDDVVTPTHITVMCVVLLEAGHETTMNLLSGGLHALLTQPEAWEELKSDPSLLDAVVEELVRFVSPANWIGRRAAPEGATIAGVDLPPGTNVVEIVASANRDPDVFPNPDRLDFHRPNQRDHLAFALGPHYCIGAALARLTARVVFRVLAERFPSVELAIDPDALEWHSSAVLPKIKSLPVALGPEHRP